MIAPAVITVRRRVDVPHMRRRLIFGFLIGLPFPLPSARNSQHICSIALGIFVKDPRARAQTHPSIRTAYKYMHARTDEPIYF